MSKHTEGPWRYWTQKRTGGEDTCTFQNLKGEEVLRAVTVTLTESDACLIAAAPELLASLQAALEVIQDYIEYEHDGDPWTEDARAMGEMDIDDFKRDGRLDAARAVILKATRTA